MPYPISSDVSPAQPTLSAQYNNLRADALRLGQASADVVDLATFFKRYISGVSLVYLATNRIRAVYNASYPPTIMINGLMVQANANVDLPAGMFTVQQPPITFSPTMQPAAHPLPSASTPLLPKGLINGSLAQPIGMAHQSPMSPLTPTTPQVSPRLIMTPAILRVFTTPLTQNPMVSGRSPACWCCSTAMLLTALVKLCLPLSCVIQRPCIQPWLGLDPTTWTSPQVQTLQPVRFFQNAVSRLQVITESLHGSEAL